MPVLLLFAFISGVVTILSPCILPVLPIVLSGGAGGGKGRPVGIIVAFIAGFTFFTLALTAIVQALGIPPDTMRWVAVGLLVLFGAVLFVPAMRDRFELLASRLAGDRVASKSRRPGPMDRGRGSWTAGFWSGLPVGVSLGLVWTPCVGPIMASVISLALTRKVNSGSVFITLAYSIGTAIPMFGAMIGGRALLDRVGWLKRNSAAIQRIFGVVIILIAAMIGFGLDRRLQTALLTAFPNYGTGLTAIEQNSAVRKALDTRGTANASAAAGATTAEMVDRSMVPDKHFTGAKGPEPQNGRLMDYGLAPNLVAQGPWFNTAALAASFDSSGSGTGGSSVSTAAPSSVPGSTPPLTMKELRGKVVLIDFWTYSCVNCIRTIPYLKAWYKTYKDKGLVIIGVHTPEFEFEKKSSNVLAAIKDLGITWPVVQDNNYLEWSAYTNRFWPAHYFIDATGHVRYYHFGEGEYATSEKVIQELLKERGEKVGKITSRPAFVNTSRTPETYLGYARSRGFTSGTALSRDASADYTAVPDLSNGEWSLSGAWTITSQYIEPIDGGTLTLEFDARNVYLVISPVTGSSGSIDVSVDGIKPANTPDVKGGVLMVDQSRLYQLVGLQKPGQHRLSLSVKGKLRLYAFTFG